MASSSKRLSVIKDDTSKIFAALEELVGNAVFIGIPEDKASRKDGDSINNATIGYVMEFGAPEQNIPARAFLIPGVQKAETPALYQMRKAADAALDGDARKIAQYLNAAGIIGANEVRGQINSNIPPALAPSTIMNRARSRGTASQRKSELLYLALISADSGGMDPEGAQTATGIVALVNTGQLRNSVTYVVRKI